MTIVYPVTPGRITSSNILLLLITVAEIIPDTSPNHSVCAIVVAKQPSKRDKKSLIQTRRVCSVNQISKIVESEHRGELQDPAVVQCCFLGVGLSPLCKLLVFAG